MVKKLYVGNLSSSVTSVQLQELFTQAGEIIAVNLITDRNTGDSKGFAFVEMATEEAAKDAINRFHGYSLSDRTLKVTEAQPREERFKSGRPGGPHH